MDEQQVAWQATPYRAPVLDAVAVRRPHGRQLVEIDADRVVRITNSRVHTSVSPADVGSLPAYREERWYHLGWGGLFRKRSEWREGE